MNAFQALIGLTFAAMTFALQGKGRSRGPPINPVLHFLLPPSCDVFILISPANFLSALRVCAFFKNRMINLFVTRKWEKLRRKSQAAIVMTTNAKKVLRDHDAASGTQ